MTKQPTISIIIPVYNVEEYITECLQSVMRQTYQGVIECILVDDCGTDNSIAVAEQLIAEYETAKSQVQDVRGRITFKILHHDHNRGLSAARNTGTDAATGDYIYYLDSDDYISDDCLEVLSEPLKERVYDMVIGDIQTFGDKQGLQYLYEDRDEIIGNDNVFAAYADRFIYVMAWNKLCKLSFLREYNITFLEGQLHEDDLWTYYVMLHIQAIAIQHIVLYYYRIHGNSIMLDTSNISRKADSQMRTLLVIQSHPCKDEKNYYKCILYYWGRYLQLAFESKQQFYKKYKQLRKSCPYNPYRLLRRKEFSMCDLKKRLHFALPIPLGYIYLQLRNLKNNAL